MSKIKNLNKNMNKTNFKKILPVVLAIALGIGGIFGTVLYTEAVVTAVDITSPTSTVKHYVKPGATETVGFNVTFDTLEASKLRVEIYKGAVTIGDTGIYDYTPASTGTTISLTANVLIGAGAADGSYDVKVSAQQPAGTGTWVSDTETDALVVDGTNPTAPTVTSPTSASYLKGGGSFDITWTTSTDTNFGATPIKIEYASGGTTFVEVTAATENDGTYTWTVPADESYSQD